MRTQQEKKDGLREVLAEMEGKEGIVINAIRSKGPKEVNIIIAFTYPEENPEAIGDVSGYHEAVADLVATIKEINH